MYRETKIRKTSDFSSDTGPGENTVEKNLQSTERKKRKPQPRILHPAKNIF